MMMRFTNRLPILADKSVRMHRSMHSRVVIDVSNLLGALPKLQWWRNRALATQTVLEQVKTWNQDARHQVCFYVEGAVQLSMPEGAEDRGVRVVHAKIRGRNASDDAIIKMLTVLDDTTRKDVIVVTSDAEFKERVKSLGCGVVGVQSLLRAMENRTPLKIKQEREAA